ncbi:MAG: hypothetical protein ABJA60_11510 [Nitrosospira sp.]
MPRKPNFMDPVVHVPTELVGCFGFGLVWKLTIRMVNVNSTIGGVGLFDVASPMGSLS